MTIINDDEITGLEYSTVKPASRERMLQQLKTIAADQAVTLKAITDIAPPNTSAPYHSAHDHGSNGAPISIPYGQYAVNVKLQERAELTTEGWQSFGFVPFYVPVGITQVNIILAFPSQSTMHQGFRFQIFNSSLELLLNQETFTPSSRTVENFIVDVEAGAVNTLHMLGFRSLSSSNKSISSIIITPQITKSRDSYDVDYGESDTSNFPSSSQYSSDYFTSFDDAMFADGMPVSSYILASLALNDALLYEVLTGSRASGRAAATMLGHNHEGHSSDYDKSGIDMDFPIASWHYGAALGSNSSTNTGHHDSDNISSADLNHWIGQTTGVTSGQTTSTQTFAEHHFSMPATKNSRTTGVSTDIKAAINLLYDQGKSGNVTVYAQIFTTDFSSSGTLKSVTGVTLGEHRETLIINNLDLPSSVGSGSGEGEYIIRFRLSQANSVEGETMVYGACLYAV